MTLDISPNLSLPDEAVTQTFGVLAVRGAGKSNTAARMAEQMYHAGLPFVVIDVVGNWWGLRSAANGKDPGLSIPIFGGNHGDIPLEKTAGTLVADLVVDQRLSCVLDLWEFSEGDKTRFLIEFAERLYKRNEAPLHLFLEEADDFIPQRPFREQARLLRAWENIVRRGRSRGLGMTMITQRSAALNKMVLTQIETLIVLRTTSPQDRKAISAWVEYHNASKELVESLPSLKDGEGWVWSPQWLGKLERVRFHLRETFDSAATPKNLKSSRRAATLADVDLGALQDKMAATIERAKADDPRELKRQIADLQRQLEAARTAEPETRTEVVEKPVITDEQLASLHAAIERYANLQAEIEDRLDKFADEFDRAISPIAEAVERTGRELSPPKVTSPQPSASTVSSPGSRSIPKNLSDITDIDINLRAGERRMLETLARHHPMKMTRAQLATLSRFTVSGGTFGTYFGVLKRHQLIDERGGEISITAAGFNYLGESPPSAPQTTEETLAMWRNALRSGERKMLDELVAVYPGSLTRTELGERTGFTVSGGTFGTYLGVLRRNGLIDTTGDQVRASDTLFLGGV